MTKRPQQSPADLAARLRRVAQYLENDAAHSTQAGERATLQAMAATCREAASSLEPRARRRGAR